MVKKSLVVDDNFYNRDLARLALENADFTVTEAENGLEALELLRTTRFDLLILDLSMPELDGHGVMAEIKKHPEYNSMKIVIITAHSHMAEGLHLDADFVMYKPIDINLFVVFLNRLNNIHV